MNIKREDSIVHAIKELYPEHATIDFKSPNEFIVYDNNMNIISVDLNAVKEKAIVHERDVLPVNMIRTERKMLLESTDWEVQRNNEMGIDNTNLLYDGWIQLKIAIGLIAIAFTHISRAYLIHKDLSNAITLQKFIFYRNMCLTVLTVILIIVGYK